MRIKRLSSAPDRAGRYRIEFDDGSVLRLYRQTVQDFGLYSGKEFSPQEYDHLQTAAGEMSAKMRAVRIVSASGVSRRDLEQRLIHKGEDPSQAKAAVQWMEELSLIDDEKTAQQIVSRCISKGYGLSRAKQALYEKRIPKELWQAALEDYPEQSSYIAAFLQEKLPAEPSEKELRHAVDALIRRGHGYGIIRQVLDQLSMDTEDFPEA